MAVSIYCVHHAEADELVPAIGVQDGSSTCGAHAQSPRKGRTLEVLSGRQVPACDDCGSTPHRAYFMVTARWLCVRHAADAVFPADDMGAHDMAHAAYITLNHMGVQNAY